MWQCQNCQRRVAVKWGWKATRASPCERKNNHSPATGGGAGAIALADGRTLRSFLADGLPTWRERRGDRRPKRRRARLGTRCKQAPAAEEPPAEPVAGAPKREVATTPPPEPAGEERRRRRTKGEIQLVMNSHNLVDSDGSPHACCAGPASPFPAPFNSTPAASRNCQSAERKRAATDLREQAATFLDSAGPSAPPESRLARRLQEVD